MFNGDTINTITLELKWLEKIIAQKVQLEQEYLYRKSFLFDLEIIIKTFTNVLFSKGVSH